MKVIKKIWPILTIAVIFAVLMPTFYSLTLSKDNGLNIKEVNLVENASVSGTGNYKNAFDDSNMTAWTINKKNAECIIEFASEKQVNALLLNEVGFNIKEYAIYFDNNGKWELCYKQNDMGKNKLASFYSISTKKIKLVINNFINTAMISDVKVYNLEKREKDDFKVTAYITVGSLVEYNAETNSTPSIYPEYFDVITDVQLIAYGEFNGDGTIKVTEDADVALANLRKIIGDRNVNIILTFFPYRQGMGEMLKNYTDKAVESVVKYVESTGADGADFDWEYPNGKKEYDLFSNFIVKLKESFTKIGGKILSIAMSPWGLNYSKEAIKAIDQVQLMAYDLFDHNGNNNSNVGSLDNCVEYMVNKGFSLKQINVGISYYGRPTDGSGVWIDYDSVDLKRDEYIMFDKNCWFNSITNVRDKAVYAILKDIGGLMVFSLNGDLPMNDPLSLTAQIGKALDAFAK